MDNNIQRIVDGQETNPLSDMVIDFLLNQTKESPILDFKITIDVGKHSDFPKIVKDVFAFANNGGGFIILGIKQNDYSDPTVKGSFILQGLPDNFEIDQATLQEKINAYLDIPLVIEYTQFFREIDGITRKFAIIYIPNSNEILQPVKDGIYKVGDKDVKAFSKGDIYVRRGTQSIIASTQEIKWIKERIKDRNYHLSILSGEPDKVTEKLFSNLFEVKIIPDKVFVAIAKFSDYREDRETLVRTYPGKLSFPLKYRRYQDKIVSFQNLSDASNPLHNLISNENVKSETIYLWQDGGDKEKIIISLLNKEFVGHAVKKEMYSDYFHGISTLFYPSESDSKVILWNSRFKGESKRIVARKEWNTHLKKFVFLHGAVQASIMKIGEQYFLKLNPTYIVTENGHRVSRGMMEGTSITRHSYRMFNKPYLTNLFFWIDSLSDGNLIKILDDFLVSTEPVQTQIDHGLSWDMPAMEVKSFIEQHSNDNEVLTEDDESSELLYEDEEN